jgi:hypothetical protein
MRFHSVNSLLAGINLKVEVPNEAMSLQRILLLVSGLPLQLLAFEYIPGNNIMKSLRNRFAQFHAGINPISSKNSTRYGKNISCQIRSRQWIFPSFAGSFMEFWIFQGIRFFLVYFPG